MINKNWCKSRTEFTEDYDDDLELDDFTLADEVTPSDSANIADSSAVMSSKETENKNSLNEATLLPRGLRPTKMFSKPGVVCYLRVSGELGSVSKPDGEGKFWVAPEYTNEFIQALHAECGPAAISSLLITPSKSDGNGWYDVFPGYGKNDPGYTLGPGIPDTIADAALKVFPKDNFCYTSSDKYYSGIDSFDTTDFCVYNRIDMDTAHLSELDKVLSNEYGYRYINVIRASTEKLLRYLELAKQHNCQYTQKVILAELKNRDIGGSSEQVESIQMNRPKDFTSNKRTCKIHLTKRN